MALYTFPVDLRWTGTSGSPGVNVWNLRTTSDAPSSGELQGLSTLIKNFYTAIAGIYPPTYTISYAGEATTISDDPIIDTSADAWTVSGGSSSLNYAPPATAICVSFRGSSGGRRGRGRKFLGPLALVDVEGDGSIAAGVLSAVRNAADALVAASEGSANGAVVIYSRVSSTGRDIVNASVLDQFAVLRSRRD